MEILNALAVEFAKPVEKFSSGELSSKIFPCSALFKANAQYDAMAKWDLGLSVFPLAYASGKIPQLEITPMLCNISDVDQGMAWRNQEIGKRVVLPEDPTGLKFRAAREYFEHLLNTQGASVKSMACSDDFPSEDARTLMAYRASPKLLSKRSPMAWRPSSVRLRVPVPTKLWWSSVGVSATQALFFQAYQAFRSWS